MTVQEAINKIDERKPNAYSGDDKISWLSQLDGLVYQEVIKKHDDYEETEENRFTGYTAEDLTTEMLITFPYENVYIDWLTMQIDLSNGDIGRYNNSAISFSNNYNQYVNWYRREHMPTQNGGWRL